MGEIINNLKNKVIVTHSGRQYVHQLLFVLQRNGWLNKFYTSFWYKPDSFFYKLLLALPAKLKYSVLKELRKRYFEPIEGEKISIYPFFELIREISDKIFLKRFSEKMLYLRDRLHDKWCSTQINPDSIIIIGYEECSLLSFKTAKKAGLITILDLAQVHYEAITEISQNYSSFGQIYKDKKLRSRINKVKQRELDLTDYIFCLSSFAKETLVKKGIKEDRIFVMNLGFDPFLFKPKINYSTKGKLKLVFVGTITKRKGLDLLLRLAREQKDLVELMLIGPLADGGDLLDQYKGIYEWIPYLEQRELNDVLNKSDLFVFPSYLDSWAMVVIEAMACGLPVIVSENTGAKDAVEEDSGFVIPAGNYKELVEKVLFFEKNRSELVRMGKNARQKSLKFTWENYYSQVEEALSKIYHEHKYNVIR